MTENPVIENILARRSVRDFTDRGVEREKLTAVLEAGRAAPSGLNNQPWRFVVVRDAGMKERIAGLTRYPAMVRGANVLVAVLLHSESCYNRDKDMHGIGACIENMWLAARSLGLGMSWNGEVINRADEVLPLLDIEPGHELMAVLCIGYPGDEPGGGKPRIALEKLILREI